MRSLSDAALVLGAAILAIAALVHFYWAVGGRAGKTRAVPEWDGRPLFTASRLAILLAGLGMLGMGLAYAAVAAGWLDGGSPWAGAIVAVVLGCVFLARGIGDFDHVGLFNKGGQTGFAKADRLIYSPICLFLAAGGLLAAATRIP